MNTKDVQDQTLYLDYSFRQTDAQLGRRHVADAMAEKYFSESPYSYAGNDPINNSDFMGLWSFPVYFNGVYGGTMSGEGNSWSGATFNGNIPGGANGEYAGIMSSVMGGHWVSRTYTSVSIDLDGWGHNSAGNLGFWKSLRRIFNPDNWNITKHSYAESSWVWDVTNSDNPAAINIYTENDMSDPFAKILISGKTNFTVTISEEYDNFSKRELITERQIPYIVDLKPMMEHVLKNIDMHPEIISANAGIAVGMGATIDFDLVLLPSVNGIDVGFFMTEGKTYGVHASVGVSVAKVSNYNLSLDDFGGWSERIQIDYWDIGGGYIWSSKYSAFYSGPGMGIGGSYAKMFSSLYKQFKIRF